MVVGAHKIKDDSGVAPSAIRPRRALNPALLGDRAISLVEGDDLFGGDGDEFLRHAARDELVGMVVGEQPAVVAPRLFIAHRRLYAAHAVGVALGGGEGG